MIMGYIWTGLIGLSIVSALLTGHAQALSAAAMQGAQEGLTLAISIGGSLCLWSGVSRLLERCGITAMLASLLRPLLSLLFPDSRKDKTLAGFLSGNITANLLGLGNAATPLGLEAARQMARYSPGVASDSLCMLVVCNTASIQLLPTTVAALRAGAGCASPFDILPAVWFTSAAALTAGLGAADLLRRVWP